MITIKKNPQKDFVILNLTDPQLGTSEWAEGHLNRTILEQTITQLVQKVQPDLITVSGDMAWAGQEHAYQMVGAFLNSFQIPWAFVWGNHDNQEGAAFIDKMATRFMQFSHCLYEKGDPAIGNGNYVIGIEEDGKIVEGLIMLDSHDKYPYTDENGKENMAWAKLTSPQLDWYKAQIRNLKEKGCKSATMILHIPIYAYLQASKAAYKSSVVLNELTVAQSMGAECWNEGYEDSVGVQYEGVSCYPAEDGVFEVVKAEGITKRIIVGHDHINNWIIRHEGVQMIYGLKTGPGCYWDPRLNGGTVLKINEKGVYDVWHEYVDVSALLKK